jgi:hypothetical protein
MGMRRFLAVLSATVFIVLGASSFAFGSMSKRDQGIRLGMEVRARIMSESYHSRSDLALWKRLLNDPPSKLEDRIGAGLALTRGFQSPWRRRTRCSSRLTWR